MRIGLAGKLWEKTGAADVAAAAASNNVARMRMVSLHRKSTMRSMSLTITEDRREVPVYGEYEVVVVGGGPAGIAAAVAAGRSGRSTLLIERYGFLGGAGTA